MLLLGVAFVTVSGALCSRVQSVHASSEAAHAQPDNYQQLAQADGSGPRVEEIIVTARRVSERLLDVPISVVAFSAESLAERGIVDLQALGAVAPGMFYTSTGTFGNSRDFSIITMRGMNTGGSSDNSKNAAVLFMDGAPM